MPSHLKDEDPRPEGVSVLDVLGNRHADRLAGIAAMAVQVPNSVSTSYIFYVNLVKKIQRRLVAITLNLPDQNNKAVDMPKPITEPAPPIAELIATSQHEIVVAKSLYSCRNCKSSFKRSDAGFRHWLQCGCVPLHAASTSEAPRHVPMGNPVHMGSQVSHHSHSLFIYKGLVYCNVCGNRGSNNQIRKLAKPCSGSPLPNS